MALAKSAASPQTTRTTTPLCHGDVVEVWAAMRGFDRPIEAALGLAREFGVELPGRDPEAQRKAQEHREREAKYMSQAEECHEALSHRHNVAEWWEGRGFDEGLRERFLLGSNKHGTAAVIPFWNRGRMYGLIHRKLRGEPKYLYPQRRA